jgi:hypothetical protein
MTRGRGIRGKTVQESCEMFPSVGDISIPYGVSFNLHS